MGEKIEFFLHEGQVVGAVDCDGKHGGKSKLGEISFLVVDDLPVHRGLLSTLLRQLFPGAMVDSAGDGMEASKRIQEHDYSMVLCDWVMPEMDGEKLVRWIRTDSADKDMPFIMVSSKDDRSEILRAFLDLGIDGYLTKPLSKAGLMSVMAVLMRPAE